MKLSDYKLQLAKAKKLMSELEYLEIKLHGEYVQFNMLKKRVNVDIYKKIINEFP
ncbi:conserved protein, unknown function [Hepatocystis sp. ex Piliocolobus tephrosceles]|nr:conserved protein, unknown function [Hepatocystis sp. ex Piliocolobus tephrosceles]